VSAGLDGLVGLGGRRVPMVYGLSCGGCGVSFVHIIHRASRHTMAAQRPPHTRSQKCNSSVKAV
jgi:hypothetical protein